MQVMEAIQFYLLKNDLGVLDPFCSKFICSYSPLLPCEMDCSYSAMLYLYVSWVCQFVIGETGVGDLTGSDVCTLVSVATGPIALIQYAIISDGREREKEQVFAGPGLAKRWRDGGHIEQPK